MSFVSIFQDVSRLAGSAMSNVMFQSVRSRRDSGSRRSLWQTSTVLTLPCLLLLAMGAFDGRLAAQPAAPAEVPASPDADAQAEKSEAAKVELPPDPIPSLTGFRFTPWYELNDDRLWKQIGWKIDLDHIPDDVDDFVELMQSPHLRDSALDLDHNVVATLGIKRLGELPNIESLRLSGGFPLSAKQMKEIGRLPRLRKLDLSQLPIGDAHVNALSPLKNLQVLNLANTQISGKSLLPIAQHVQLEELYIGGDDLTDNEQWRIHGYWRIPLIVRGRNLFRLKGLTKLRTLQVRAFEFGDTGGFDLLPQLETLDLRRATQQNLQDAEIKAIARLSKLRTLRLPHSPEVKQVSLLRPLTRLRRLDPIWGKNREQLKAEIRRHLPQTDFGSSDVRALDDRTSVRYSKVPLHDALRFLSRTHEIPIHRDGPALGEIGVSARMPIDAVYSGITLREVLHRMLSAHGLIAIPHYPGLTVTTWEGNRLYHVDYDLSELLRGVEAGDNLTVRLSQILQDMISPDVWGREFPVLPDENTPGDGPGRILGDQPEKSLDVDMATAEITEASTTLTVMAPAKTHAAIRNVVNQLTRGEDSQLLDVELRQLVDRQFAIPGYDGKLSANFSELPLIDSCEYLTRSFQVPAVVDVVGYANPEISTMRPVNYPTFECDTLGHGLDQLLEPLKLTWIYEDDVIKVVHASQQPTIVVHQLFDGMVRPQGAGYAVDWHDHLEAISKQGTGLSNPRFEIWHGRLIVNEPWRNQLKLARLLRKFSHPPRAHQAVRN
jgi:Leucine-rich repeat (LRR) protein